MCTYIATLCSPPNMVNNWEIKCVNVDSSGSDDVDFASVRDCNVKCMKVLINSYISSSTLQNKRNIKINSPVTRQSIDKIPHFQLIVDKKYQAHPFPSLTIHLH